MMRSVIREHLLREQVKTSKTFEIEASPNVMKAFEQFMAHLAYCASVGHSTTVAMTIDGDGADRFRVTSGSSVKGSQAQERSRYDRPIEVIVTGD